jgi:NAD(P)-dependent dehydrogenase (short-subunit alcohol dehydrogenase family)
VTAPLAGTSTLVTGGGSGIGLACARRIVQDGGSVTLMGRTRDTVRAAAWGLRAGVPRGVSVRWMAGDVADEEAVVQAVALASESGGLDAAVLAASRGRVAPLVLLERAAWQAVLDTNLTGTFLCVKHAGAAMARSGGGSIVAISSVAAVRSHRFMAAYAVSKSGVDALVATAADELGVARVRVNSVRPGLVPTDRPAGLDSDDGVKADYLAQMPLERLGTTDEVAALVRFLVGPESAWITGESISVDGGHHLRRGPDLEPWVRSVYGDDAAEGRPG